jgi:septal ring factor EnvC (AmiA/AmiB activator)
MKAIRGIKIVINTLIKPFKRLYVIIGNICYNINFLCTKNIKIELINIMMDNTIMNDHNNAKITKLKSRVSRIFDNIDIDGIEDRIYSLESDMENNKWRVCRLMSDIKEINNKLNDINDNKNDSIDNLIERDLLIDEVIKSIINRLDKNDNV